MDNERAEKKQKAIRSIVSTVLLCLCVIALVLSIRHWFVDIRAVDGSSMYPTFEDGDRIIVKRFGLDDIQLGDIVVVNDGERDLIKRVIGLPGETVHFDIDGQIFINKKKLDDEYQMQVGETSYLSGKWVLEDDEYFVLGDNRTNSKDSREYGPFKQDQIEGVYVSKWKLLPVMI